MAKCRRELRQFLVNATSLAALATIADVVPLVGENRILAHFGLLGLKQCSLTGMQALLESAGLLNEKLDSYHVGFMLAPRLNACGRMGHAAEAVEMLTSATPERAKEIAVYLEEQNRERQATEQQILDQAMEQIENSSSTPTSITPSSLAAKAGMPAWSASSRPASSTASTARPSSSRSTTAKATAPADRSPAFTSPAPLPRWAICSKAPAATKWRPDCTSSPAGSRRSAPASSSTPARRSAPELLTPELRIDAEAQLGEIGKPLVDQFHRLGPFGPGNRGPILCCSDVELIQDPVVVGRAGDHLQLRIRQGNTSMKCIAFKFGELASQLHRGMRLDLAVEPTLNTYNGFTSVELDVKDLRVRM